MALPYEQHKHDARSSFSTLNAIVADTQDKMSQHDAEKYAEPQGGSDEASSLGKGTEPVRSSPSRRRLAAAVVIFASLVVALGVGLGAGLKHRSSSNSSDEGYPISKLVNASAAFTPAADWNSSAAPQTRSFTWELTVLTASPAGVDKTILAINGMSPGPMIEANLGDTLLISVKNSMINATAIHWHGQRQNGTNWMDGTAGITQCSIAPGASFTYNWTVQDAGTYWYHAHQAGQYSDGLYGALILHSPDEVVHRVALEAAEENVNTTYHEDRVIMLADLWNDLSGAYIGAYLSIDGPPGGGQGDEPVPDCSLINGIGHCYGDKKNYANSMTVEAGKRYRLRIINAGSLASFRFAIDGHMLLVVEADGTEVEPVRVQSLTVHVAQRYSVIVEMDQTPAAYILHGDMTDDMLAYEPLTLIKEQSMVMRYAGVSEAAEPATVAALPSNIPDLDPSSLVPAVPVNPPDASRQESFLVSFGLTSDSQWRAFVNGTSWDRPEGATLMGLTDARATGQTYDGLDYGQLILTTTEVVTIDYIFNNEDDGDHPMHLHGYTPWVLGSGAGVYQHGQSSNLSAPFVNPMRRDVFMIPMFGWTVVRVTLDIPGLFAFHCHLGSHMAAGFLLQLSVMLDKIGTIPQANRDLCKV